jgi:hypothetical protein
VVSAPDVAPWRRAAAMSAVRRAVKASEYHTIATLLAEAAYSLQLLHDY